MKHDFFPGDYVEKHMGEARYDGWVLCRYKTTKGMLRYVIEVQPQGFQMIVSSVQLRLAPERAPGRFPLFKDHTEAMKKFAAEAHEAIDKYVAECVTHTAEKRNTVAVTGGGPKYIVWIKDKGIVSPQLWYDDMTKGTGQFQNKPVSPDGPLVQFDAIPENERHHPFNVLQVMYPYKGDMDTSGAI